jgi:hypothetical protein
MCSLVQPFVVWAVGQLATCVHHVTLVVGEVPLLQAVLSNSGMLALCTTSSSCNYKLHVFPCCKHSRWLASL